MGISVVVIHSSRGQRVDEKSFEHQPTAAGSSRRRLAPPLAASSRISRVWRDPRLAWLRAEISDLEHELWEVVECKNIDGTSTDHLPLRCIDRAREACDRHDVNSGWTHLYRARQEMIMFYGEDRLRIAARTLSREVDDPGRLPAWRAEVIKTLLAETGWLSGEGQYCSGGSKLSVETGRKLVAEALKLRNDGVSNDCWRLAIVRHYQGLLTMIGAPVLALVVFMLSGGSKNLFRGDWITSHVSCVLAVLVGILGAVASAVQRSTRIRRERVTVQLGSYASSFSRIPIGAVAGFTVWLFSIATANAASINAPNLLLAAFGAGFAERLIVQGQANERNEMDNRRTA